MGCFACPAATNDESYHTHYFGVHGPNTFWSIDIIKTTSDVTDPLDETIMLIEVGGRNTPWTQPTDLTLEETVDLLTGKNPNAILHGELQERSLFHVLNSSRVNVAMADGHVRSLYLPLDEATARALLTANGGEEIDEDELTRRRITKQLNYRGIYGLSLFVLLALLPGVVLWRKKREVTLQPS